MPYIGSQQGTSAPVLLDAISVVNGQAAYTLQKGGLNYQPASTLVMQVSLNGIIQQPGGGSYTIDGSTITFASNLVTGDVIDYILVREPTTGTIAPVDGSITDSKIVSMAASKLTGALPAIDGSSLTGVGTILQVVQGIKKDAASTTSATFASSGLSASITPSSTSSKILVSISVLVSGVTDSYGALKLYRGTSEITDANSTAATGSNSNVFIPFTGRSANDEFKVQPLCGNYLDSPSTTSSTTYNVYWAKLYGTSIQMNSPYYTDTGNSYINHGVSTVTLMEISN